MTDNNKQIRAKKEFAVADKLAKQANSFASDARLQNDLYKKQKYRFDNWKSIMSTAPVLAFTVVFVIVAIGEYLISKEIYREFNDQAPWAIAIVFLIAGVFISDLIVYKLFRQKKEWKRFELKQDPNNETKTDDEITRIINNVTNRNFILGLAFGIIFIAAIGALSYSRVQGELNAGMRQSNFGIMDIMPIILYVIELIAGVFIMHLLKQTGLSLKVKKYYKRFNKFVAQCGAFTSQSVKKYQDAEKENYDPLSLQVSDNIHKVFYRNNSTNMNDVEKYIGLTEKIKDVLKLKIIDETGNPLQKHVAVITDYKFSATNSTNTDGKVTFYFEATYPGDSCDKIIVRDSSNSEDYIIINERYDLDKDQEYTLKIK